MEKIAYVTGATGCIGRNLVNELLKEKWSVIVLHRASSDLSKLVGCDVTFQEVDITDITSLRKGIQISADAIFHLAANLSNLPSEADQQWRDNVLATRNLAEIALERGIKRFIFTSTGATLGSQWMDEETTQKLVDVGYIRTKRLAEIEIYKAIEKGLDAVILKPIIVIGPYDYNHYKKIFDMMKKKHGPKIVLPGRIAFCHAIDVASAHIKAFESGRKGEDYVLGGEFTSWLDCAQRICKIYGTSPPRKPVPLWFLKIVSYGMLLWARLSPSFKPDITPAMIKLLHDSCDVSLYHQMKARNDLGYNSRSLDEAIMDYIHWEKYSNLK